MAMIRPRVEHAAPPAGTLPHRGQGVRIIRSGDPISGHVAWTDGWGVHVTAEIDPGPEDPWADHRVRLIWRGETHAMCIEGEISAGRTEWTITCDPASLSSLEERSRRRVAVRAPVHLTVPTRLAPEVGTTWSINLSESGVALEPPHRFMVSTSEILVMRLLLEDLPVLTVGRVVAAGPSEPVRVAFERMSPTVKNQLIGAVNRLEAASRIHAR